ncbi:MAG: hypothetical protein KGI63_08200 [Xanthomonadaceae bacterium]|nr:hypothetical protein [Xanthomonadaceae bacterium]
MANASDAEAGPPSACATAQVDAAQGGVLRPFPAIGLVSGVHRARF